MAKRLLGAFLVLLAVALAAGAYCLYNTDARRVRRRLDDLAEAVSKESGEGNIVMVFKMQTLGNLLDDRVSVYLRDYPFPNETSNAELVSLATRGRTYFHSLSVSIVETEVELLGGEQARCRCSARVNGSSQDRSYRETRFFDADLRKIDGEWRFRAFREDNLLKK